METSNIEKDILTDEILLSDCQEPNEVIDVRDMNEDEFMAMLKQISDDVCLVVEDSDSTKKELKPLIKDIVEETIKEFNGENTNTKD